MPGGGYSTAAETAALQAELARTRRDFEDFKRQGQAKAMPDELDANGFKQQYHLNDTQLDHGTDILNVVRRVAIAEADARAADMERRFEEKVSAAREQDFLTALARQYPNYRQLYDSRAFQDFMRLHQPHWYQVVQTAEQRLDPEPIVQAFRAFEGWFRQQTSASAAAMQGYPQQPAPGSMPPGYPPQQQPNPAMMPAGTPPSNGMPPTMPLYPDAARPGQLIDGQFPPMGQAFSPPRFGPGPHSGYYALPGGPEAHMTPPGAVSAPQPSQGRLPTRSQAIAFIEGYSKNEIPHTADNERAWAYYNQSLATGQVQPV